MCKILLIFITIISCGYTEDLSELLNRKIPTVKGGGFIFECKCEIVGEKQNGIMLHILVKDNNGRNSFGDATSQWLKLAEVTLKEVGYSIDFACYSDTARKNDDGVGFIMDWPFIIRKNKSTENLPNQSVKSSP